MPIGDDFQDNAPAPNPAHKKRLGVSESNKRYRRNKLSVGLRVACGVADNGGDGTRCVPCRKRHRENCERVKPSSDYRREHRNRVFEGYGWTACACCGETNGKLLTIDHVNGDGAAHRRSLGKRPGSYSLYLSIVRDGFPQGVYACLCFNCNLGRARNGGVCPHMEVNHGWRLSRPDATTKPVAKETISFPVA